MENVVPGILQRLRAADIIRMAGLTAASLGQEYSRLGAVQQAQRAGTRLSGIVDTSLLSHLSVAIGQREEGEEDREEEEDKEDEPGGKRHQFLVVVDIKSPTSWESTCACNAGSTLLCSHAAALLYHWLGHPGGFITVAETAAQPDAEGPSQEKEEASPVPQPAKPAHIAHTNNPVRVLAMQSGPVPVGDLLSMLSQMGLSDLRAMAREYEIVPNGLSRQQLAEAIQGALQQPEAVRRVATTLEKAQRQLLAALVLAGGAMSDDDLRGLYERFSLGQPSQYQPVLMTLQSKALLLRASLNSTTAQRSGLSGALLDVGWYVPLEVRTALRVMVPVTLFRAESSEEKPRLQTREPLGLLADLLLVARALEGYHLEQQDEWLERKASTRMTDMPSVRLPGGSDGSAPVPPPLDTPSASMLASLQEKLERPPAFLRFAVRLLRLADILHQDDTGKPYLCVLPDAAQLLLGPTSMEAARDLFELWLTQSSYEELFELQEEGVRLRCRATSLHVPLIRPGELDAENREARQLIVTLLSQAPLDQWISFPAFARFLYRLNPLYIQKKQRHFSAPHWWLELDEGRPLRPLSLGDWSRAEAHYLARLLRGPLHWWGICDLAHSADGRLLAFRLTPFANWLLHGIAPVSQSEELNYQNLAASLEVVDSEEVLITSSTQAWPTLAVIEQFAETMGVQRGRLRYRLTPKAVGEALSRGKQATRLLEMLRLLAEQQATGEKAERRAIGEEMERAGVNPAPAVQTSLADMLVHLERWIASYGRVRLYSGVTLLETADTMVMRELSATTSLQEQIVQTIHPTLLILKQTGAERMIEDLKRRGQSPLLHNKGLYGSD